MVSQRCTLEELEDGNCAEGAELVENFVPLPQDATVDQLLTSANGRWLVVRTERQLRIIDLESPQFIDGTKQFTAIAGPPDAEKLVGSLRTGDWVIYRSADGLKGYDIANNEIVGLSQPGDDFFVTALGDRHVVVRSPTADGGENLHMLTVDPYRALDSTRPDQPTFLTHTSGRFTQVTITRGRTPGDDPHPTDHRIVATASEGAQGPVTMVFDAHSGDAIDQFPGQVVTSLNDLTSVEGLSAATPDGKAIAYITPNESVALRDLDGGGSCLVRSHRSGEHGLAGFSADGMLFFESFEYDRYSNTKQDRVYGYNPRTGTSDALTPADESHTLKAVPPGMVGLGSTEHPDETLTWAITLHGGARWAVQPNAEPQPVTAADATFLTRPSPAGTGGSQSLLLVEARAVESDDIYSYSVGRITARVGSMIDGEYQADILDSADPEVCLEQLGHDCYSDPVGAADYSGVSFHKQAEVCVSTPRVSGWARDCYEHAQQANPLSPRLPISEEPYN